MRFRIKELKGAVSYYALSQATGIDRKTLGYMNDGDFKSVRGIYISVLCKYFCVTPSELIEVDKDIELPLTEALRKVK